MIRLRMSPRDLERMRFAYSPLAEVAESLYVLHSGQIPSVHHAWFQATRKQFRRVDMGVLRAIVPAPRPHVANFLLSGATEPSTSIRRQLALVADCPTSRLRQDLDAVWRGDLPPETQCLLEHDPGPRIADALWQYWRVAIAPHWPQIRAVLDADVAYRATRLARGGIEALLADLHPELELAEHAIHVTGGSTRSDHDLQGDGLLLVPCVFAWPHLMVDPGDMNPPSITYGPRGLADLWPGRQSAPDDGETLAGLLGRSRAQILLAVGYPKSTSDLSRELSLSTPSVSQHLTVLRQSGLVNSWRAGRRVLYQRTPLATSVVAASRDSAPSRATHPD